MAFSLLICLVATTFVLLNVFSRMETIYSKICAKPPPMNAKRPLPVTVRRLKPPLVKLPITSSSAVIDLFFAGL